MRSLIFILIMLHSSNSFSQSKYTFDFSGYLETYYAYNTSSLLKNNTSQFPFTYNHNRQNEVNINLGLLKAKFEQDGIRANLGMMMGSYAAANLAAALSASAEATLALLFSSSWSMLSRHRLTTGS
jgi:hypothetical protein